MGDKSYIILKWMKIWNKCDRYRESIWSWFGSISRKQKRRGFYNIDLVIHLTKYKIFCTLSLAEIFDEIQCKTFPKVRRAYFLSLYGWDVPINTCICTRVAPSVKHVTTDPMAPGATLTDFFLLIFIFLKSVFRMT